MLANQIALYFLFSENLSASSKQMCLKKYKELRWLWIATLRFGKVPREYAHAQFEILCSIFNIYPFKNLNPRSNQSKQSKINNQLNSWKRNNASEYKINSTTS